MKPVSYIDKIRALASAKLSYTGDIQTATEVILNNPKFPLWSGSAKLENHHYGDYGLARHTYEVVSLCFSNRDMLGINLDGQELFLAALYHDVGKMWDYDRNPTTGMWEGTEHKRNIHHISRSALCWSNTCTNLSKDFYLEYHDKVLHAILSHHGCREWGSPVMPNTRVAWMVHLCDGISARMDDWNKLYFLKH